MVSYAENGSQTTKNGDGSYNINGEHPSKADLAFAQAVVRHSRGHQVSSAARDAALKDLRWGGLLQSLEDIVNPDLLAAWPSEWLDRHTARHPTEAGVMRRAIGVAEVLVNIDPDDIDALRDSEYAHTFKLKVYGARELVDTEFPMEWHVTKILIALQPCVIAASKKALKTTLAIDLALSLASGEKFLGHFDVTRPTPVLMISGESGGFVIKETIDRICRSKEINFADLERNFFIGFVLPQLNVEAQLDALVEVIREHGIKVVIIDPLYLCLLGGNRRLDPANLFDMGPLLMAITKKCLDAGCTPVLIHHFKKTGVADPYALPEMESIAFAGIQEFARQWILIGRRERFVPGSGQHRLWLLSGGSGNDGGEWAVDIDEGHQADDFSGRRWEVSVKFASEARTDFKEQDQAAKATAAAEKTRTKDEVKERQRCDDVETALENLIKKGPASKTGWRERLNWNTQRFGPVFAKLLESGRIRQVEVAVPNGTAGRPTIGWEHDPTVPTIIPIDAQGDRFY